MSNFTDQVSGFIRRHPVLSNIVLAIAAVLVLAWITLMFLDVWTHHGATSVVPDIKNMDYRQAIEVLDDHNLEIEVSDSVFISDLAENLRKNARPGMILESWPKAGAVVKKGRPVYVTLVAYSPKEVILTSPIDNVSSRQAISVLQSLGISNVRIVSVPSMYNDNVERALYNGRPIGVGSSLPVTATITLEVGKAVAPDPVYDDEFNEFDSDDTEAEGEADIIVADDASAGNSEAVYD